MNPFPDTPSQPLGVIPPRQEGALAALRHYWRQPLPADGSAKAQLRWLGGFFVAVGFAAFAAGLFLLPMTPVGLALLLVCTTKAAVVWTVAIAAVDLGLVPWLTGDWGAFGNRTVGKQWGIGVLAFLAGFGVHALPGRPLQTAIDLLFAGTGHPSNPSNDLPSYFVQLLPLFLATTGVMIHLRTRENLVSALQWLESRHGEVHAASEAVPATPAPQQAPHDGNTAGRRLVLETGGTSEVLDVDQISHVTVEEHYTRIFVKNGGYRALEVKLPLKEALKLLPEPHFVQTHRSHVVNMAFVTKVEKAGSAYQLHLDHGAHALPLSRQRAPGVLTTLREFWAHTA